MSFIPFSPLFLVLLTLACVPFTPRAISSCNGPCRTLNDCAGQLICINGKCNDDPDLGTHICGGTPPSTIPPPPRSGGTISSCNGPCRTLNDCAGQLICIKGKCNDDPNLGTHICTSPVSPPSTVPPPPSSVRSPPPPLSGGCQSSGTLVCGGMSYPEYSCSPPVTSSTSAILTNNDFSQGGDGGAPSECDNMYHQNSELIVALSTGWYSGGSRCGKMINIKSVKTGSTVKAKVVDECDSINGCDAEHAYQPPCRNNIVDGSDAVWSALGLDKNVGEEDVTWSMA